MRSLVASLCRDDITAAQPLLVILSTVLVILSTVLVILSTVLVILSALLVILSAALVILSAALVILSTVLVILSAVLVILSAAEGSLFPKLQSCREILRFALLSQDDIAVARLDGTQARHPERPTCHPERSRRVSLRTLNLSAKPCRPVAIN